MKQSITTTNSLQEGSRQSRVEIAINRNSLKCYNSGNFTTPKVFLKNKQEFQLKLIAPTVYDPLLCRNLRWGVEIYMNERLISTSKIVLDGGETIFLDRGPDSPYKFKFDVFDVENVAETKKARERNGKITVKWYKEIPSDPVQYWLENINQPRTKGIYGDSSIGFGAVNCYYNANIDVSFNTTTSTIETGRITEGSLSDKRFTTVNVEFHPWVTYVDNIQLMPISHNNGKASEFINDSVAIKKVREYCSECGTRIRNSTWKYCAQCGHKL